jgi:hypothetical protein
LRLVNYTDLVGPIHVRRQRANLIAAHKVFVVTMIDRIRMLVDNATLDTILRWDPEVRARLATCVANRHFVIYFAPETVAEMFSIGSTSRADRLQPLAKLMLAIFNGRILNHHFWRILDEVNGQSASPFLAASKARRILENINHVATARNEPDRSWFNHGAELIRREKTADQRWRTGFQQMYRDRDRGTEDRRPLEEFIRTSTVRDLLLSRVEAICVEAKVPNAAIRASEIVTKDFARLPALTAHLHLRIARLWWYTESTDNGRRASDDLFDDALLHYLNELDVLLTPDRALIDFGRRVFPQKKFLSPDAFCTEYLNGIA